MLLVLAAVLACQEEPLQTLMARWGEDDPARRDDASRRIVARWKDWKDEDLAKLRAVAEGSDTELAGRAKDAFATIQLRRRLGASILAKLPDAADLVVRGAAEQRLRLLVRATELWEKGELKDDSLRALAQAGCDAGWTLDGHAFLEHVHNRGVKAYVPLVVPFLRHSDPAFRGLAAQRLGRLGAAEHAAAVARLLEDDDGTVRSAAILSLGELKATEHYRKLVPVLADGPPGLVEDVLHVLACCEARPSVAEAVAELLSSPKESVRSLALRVLGAMGAHAYADRVAAFLKDPSQDLKRSALWSLGSMGASEQADRLLPFLEGEEIVLRTEAIRALGRTGRRDLVPRLIPLLKEGGNDVAWMAADAIVDLGPTDPLPDLAQLLKDPGGTGVAYGVQILGRLGAREHSKPIAALLDHHQPMVRAEAVRAVARLDPVAYAKELLPLLEDQFEEVRRDACLAVAALPHAELPAATRQEVLEKISEIRKSSLTGQTRAAAGAAWVCLARPEPAALKEVLKLVQDNYHDDVVDTLLTCLERTHEREAHDKLDRPIRLDQAVDSWERVAHALSQAGLRLEGAGRPSFRGRVPSGARTTPRKLLRRAFEGIRPEPAAGTIRLVSPIEAMEAWEKRLSR